MLRRSRTQDLISLKYRLCPISQSGRAVPGVDMPRASRFVLTAAVLICLITLNSGGWLKSSLKAASDPPGNGLRFDGSQQYVTFGPATATLGAKVFTLELWFMREGAGVTASTGTGGVIAAPLIAKGVGETDNRDNKDANYFLGIDPKTRTLVADFEDTATSANHPITGSTKIWDNVWYHAAAVFDGTKGTLYLNGVQDAPVTGLGTFTPRFAS